MFGGFLYSSGSFLGLRKGQALYMLAGCGATVVLALHAAATLLLRGCGLRGLHTPPQSQSRQQEHQQQRPQRQPAPPEQLPRPQEPPLLEEESGSAASQQPVGTPTRGAVN